MGQANVSGSFVYRSLQNDKDVQTNFEELEFGRGIMTLTQTNDTVKGNFEMGPGYSMTLEGTVLSSGAYSYLKMTAYGVPGTATDKWIYDYFGLIVPVWPNAVAQVPTVTGSVIRTVDHGGAKAGVTATFYMVLTT